jgi:hypothetical protein
MLRMHGLLRASALRGIPHEHHNAVTSMVYQEKPEDRLQGRQGGNLGFTLIATALALGDPETNCVQSHPVSHTRNEEKLE